MKLSDEAVPAFAWVIGNDAQAIAKRKGISEARQDRRTAARRSRAPARRETPVAVYTRLLKIEEARRFIQKAESLERLTRRQVAYFDSAMAGEWASRTSISGSRPRGCFMSFPFFVFQPGAAVQSVQRRVLHTSGAISLVVFLLSAS